MKIINYFIFILGLILSTTIKAETYNINATFLTINYYAQVNDVNNDLKNVILLTIQPRPKNPAMPPNTCGSVIDQYGVEHQGFVFSVDNKELLSMVLFAFHNGRVITLGIDDAVKYPASTNFCEIQIFSVANL